MNLLRRLFFYFRRAEFDRELEEEMRLHRELKVEEKVSSGMSLDEARWEAQREFGRTSRLLEASRETWSVALVDSLWQDVRLGIRALATRPVFTGVALVSLGLGIGANTAVFTLVNQAFFRPLPVRAPEELLTLQNDRSRRMFPAFSYPNYEDVRDRSGAFAGLLAYRFAPLSVSHDGVAERTWGYLVSGNYFDVLGIEPAAGRLLTSSDDVLPGGHPVAVLSHRGWLRRFGGDPAAVGKDMLINGRSYTLVGVAAPGFDGTEVVAPDVFLPMAMQAAIERGRSWLDDRAQETVYIQGRLRPGIGLERARAELESVADELEREHPDIHEGAKISVAPAGLLSGRMRSALLGFSGILLAVVGLALLLACTNLANLLLARAAERRREIGMSLALGAGRLRLVRRLLTECLVLAGLGGAVGFLLAFWLTKLVSALRPPIDFPLDFELDMDWRVLLFNAAVSCVAALLFGLLPAWRMSAIGPRAALGDELSEGRTRFLPKGSVLTMVQVALSLVLLVASGLSLRGLTRAQELELGFDPEKAVEVSFDLGLQSYPEGRGRELQREILERVRALPGVEAAGISDFVPVDLHFARTRLFVEGEPIPSRIEDAPITFVSRVSEGYLGAMSMPLVAGRDFTEADDSGARPVALVSEALAKRFWPGEDGLGKHLSVGTPDAPALEVVGVVADARYAGLGEQPQPFVYLSIRQSYTGTNTLVARAGADPGRLLPSIRDEIHRIDPVLALFTARELSERLALPLFAPRIAATLLGAFALLALTLAAVGTYGVMSQMVARRRREIGIRVALGARREDVLTLAMTAGMLPTLLGVAIGSAFALVLSRWMTSLLFGVSPQDPWTFGATAALLLLVGALSCFFPARAAAVASPTRSLRTE
jgi:predicted permease